jgi:hypothetical protein
MYFVCICIYDMYITNLKNITNLLLRLQNKKVVSLRTHECIYVYNFMYDMIENLSNLCMKTFIYMKYIDHENSIFIGRCHGWGTGLPPFTESRGGN